MVQTILWFILCGCLFMIGALTIYWLALGARNREMTRVVLAIGNEATYNNL